MSTLKKELKALFQKECFTEKEKTKFKALFDTFMRTREITSRPAIEGFEEQDYHYGDDILGR